MTLGEATRQLQLSRSVFYHLLRRLQTAATDIFPSSLRTTLALRQGIWRKGDPHWEICGIPDLLYTDNGSDFRSKHLEQVAADLKIRLVFSTPGQPQGEAASSDSFAR